MRFLLLVLLTLVPSSASAADKVKGVRARRSAEVKEMFQKVNLPYPPGEVYLRAFKSEAELELWAGRKGKKLELVKTYRFCAASGGPGPKRKQGDLQVPEGLYELVEFNPHSQYHLSMKISYPNSSDRLRSGEGDPGGLIYLHGKCASIGCIAIDDGPIEEVYLVALDAKTRPIRFDIFPQRLTAQTLSNSTGANAEFWWELLPAFSSFEATHRPASFSIDPRTGAYLVRKSD